jgi:hypothetical protein
MEYHTKTSFNICTYVQITVNMPISSNIYYFFMVKTSKSFRLAFEVHSMLLLSKVTLLCNTPELLTPAYSFYFYEKRFQARGGGLH